MWHTSRESEDTTHRRMTNACRRQHPVTIAYQKPDHDDPCLRTIEIYDVLETMDGNTVLKVMDRTSGERRTFRLDRILTYQVHRTAYTLPSPHPLDDTPSIPPREMSRGQRVTRLVPWSLREVIRKRVKRDV